MIWGFYWGSLLTVLGGGIGAAAAFLIARYVASDYLNVRVGNAAWCRFRGEIDSGGWRAVAFVRVNPVIPFGPSSYLFGLTSVGFRSYLLTTLLAIFPLSVAFSFIGDSVGGGVWGGDADRLVRALLLVSSVVTVIALLKLISRCVSASLVDPGLPKVG